MLLLNAPARPRSDVIDDDDDALALLVLREQRVRGALRVAGHVAEQLHHRERVRARRLDALLRLLDLRRRDHLHGARDLARALHAHDPLLDVSKVRHRLCPLALGRELGLELGQGLAERLGGLVGELLLGDDRLADLGIGALDELEELVAEALDVVDGRGRRGSPWCRRRSP